jgi:hypothetical protein
MPASSEIIVGYSNTIPSSSFGNATQRATYMNKPVTFENSRNWQRLLPGGKGIDVKVTVHY